MRLGTRVLAAEEITVSGLRTVELGETGKVVSLDYSEEDARTVLVEFGDNNYWVRKEQIKEPTCGWCKRSLSSCGCDENEMEASE